MFQKLTIAFIFCCFQYLNAQDYSFSPDWAKGDGCSITWVTTEQEFEGDVLISDTTYENNAELRVISSDKESILIEKMSTKIDN